MAVNASTKRRDVQQIQVSVTIEIPLARIRSVGKQVDKRSDIQQISRSVRNLYHLDGGKQISPNRPQLHDYTSSPHRFRKKYNDRCFLAGRFFHPGNQPNQTSPTSQHSPRLQVIGPLPFSDETKRPLLPSKPIFPGPASTIVNKAGNSTDDKLHCMGPFPLDDETKLEVVASQPDRFSDRCSNPSPKTSRSAWIGQCRRYRRQCVWIGNTVLKTNVI